MPHVCRLPQSLSPELHIAYPVEDGNVMGCCDMIPTMVDSKIIEPTWHCSRCKTDFCWWWRRRFHDEVCKNPAPWRTAL